MPLDKFGIRFWYPTKSTAGVSGSGTGFFWEQSDNFRDDEEAGMLRLGKETDACELIDEDTGEWMFPFTFAYDYSPSLSLSGPTGHHSGGETHGCQGFTYMIDSHFDTNPIEFLFRKETYHVQYNTDPLTKTWTNSSASGPVEDTWKGFGWVRYNKRDGRGPGQDSVICEAWWNDDPEADINNWVMLKRTEDKGAGISNWGVKATCDGDDYQVGTWSNIQFRFKSSGSDFSLHPLIPETNDGDNIDSIGGEDMSFSECENRGYGKRADMPRDIEMKCLFKWNASGQGKCHFKNISLREIDPTKEFDDNPDVPEPGTEPTDTSTIQGQFKFNWDINQLRTSPCAGAGTTQFFFVEPIDDIEISNHSSFSNRTRLAEKCTNSSSVLLGKTILSLQVPLKKVGTPGASPTITAKIWNAANTVVYTSPTAIDPTTLTTSFTTQTFSFSTNTHVMVVGDRIGIEYTGTSNTDYIVGGYDGDNPYLNSTYGAYESAAWVDRSSRDMACEMFV